MEKIIMDNNNKIELTYYDKIMRTESSQIPINEVNEMLTCAYILNYANEKEKAYNLAKKVCEVIGNNKCNFSDLYQAYILFANICDSLNKFDEAEELYLSLIDECQKRITTNDGKDGFMYYKALAIWSYALHYKDKGDIEAELIQLERVEKILNRANLSYYKERYDLYMLMTKEYESVGNIVDSARCQFIAERLKKLL
jgi:tetratricopeptide (TPR) repeat protein